jgi:hypothetical protein
MNVRRAGVVSVITIAFVLAGFLSAWGGAQKKEREDYTKAVNEKLESWEKKINELKGKAAELKEEAKKEFNKGMIELLQKQKAAKKEWKSVKRAAGDKWEKVKSDMDAAIQNMEKAYNKLTSRFKEGKD